MFNVCINGYAGNFNIKMKNVNRKIEIVLDKYRLDKSYTLEHINELESLISEIYALRKFAKNENERWAADFLYTDGLNEITRVKIKQACDVIDNLNGYELIDVRDHLENVISADPILKGRLD